MTLIDPTLVGDSPEQDQQSCGCACHEREVRPQAEYVDRPLASQPTHWCIRCWKDRERGVTAGFFDWLVTT